MHLLQRKKTTHVMFRKTWNRDLKSPGHYLAIHTSTFSWTVLQCIPCPWPSISRVLRYGLTENTVYPAHDLNGTLAWYFFVLVFCTVKKPNNKTFECFGFCSWIGWLIQIF
jgi:hypothetical protein